MGAQTVGCTEGRKKEGMEGRREGGGKKEKVFRRCYRLMLEIFSVVSLPLSLVLHLQSKCMVPGPNRTSVSIKKLTKEKQV